MKKVSGKKQRDQAAQDAEMRKRREQEAAPNGDTEDGTATQDVLGEHEDDDVIF